MSTLAIWCRIVRSRDVSQPPQFRWSRDVRSRVFSRPLYATDNGAGTNLKVGAPVRSESGGTDPALNFFLVVPLHFFGSKSTISRFGDRFCDGQYSFVSFFVVVLPLTVPPVPSHL